MDVIMLVYIKVYKATYKKSERKWLRLFENYTHAFFQLDNQNNHNPKDHNKLSKTDINLVRAKNQHKDYLTQKNKLLIW